MKKVAIQGIAGSFHDIASRNYFAGEEIEILPCRTFKEVFDSVKADFTLLAAVAIENTIAGSLLPNHNLLLNSGLAIIGEYKLRIEHNLAALAGQHIDDIREVYSHPIALMQCEDFLEQHKNLKAVESEDTASSALMVAQRGERGIAAICGKLAAQEYDLQILAEGIETNKRNFTRFLILADKNRALELLADKQPNKSSVVFTLPHEEGSLAHVLSILSFYKMNLTKIQSLPIIGREWEYRFFINLVFSDYDRYRQALDAIIPLTSDFHVLGEYVADDKLKQN